MGEAIKIHVTCRMCNEVSHLEVTVNQLERYKKGAYVQDAFPNLKAHERELLISRTCQKCWDNMFGDEDE